MRRGVSYLLSAVLIAFISARAGLCVTPELVLLNVGEGLSVAVIDEENQGLLIDAGNPVAGPLILKFFRSKGIGRLSSIIITHPHPDHMGGIFTLLGLLDVDSVFDNGQPIPRTPPCDLVRWYAEYVRGRTGYSLLKGGDQIKVSRNISLDVLWPLNGKAHFSSNWNENSLVLMLRFGAEKILIMGDATMRVEAILAKEGKLGPVDGLVVGHHGADDATSMNFLRVVTPKWAYISVDKDNIRGYPGKRTIRDLRAMGTTVLYSFAHGDCHLYMGDKDIKCNGSTQISPLH